jgi:hypothetical protein
MTTTTFTTTTLPVTTTTTTSTTPIFLPIAQGLNIFSPSGLQRIDVSAFPTLKYGSSSMSDGWNGYGVSPSGSGITNFYSTGSFVHYEVLGSGGATQINPNNLLKQADQRFELYDSNLRSSGPRTVTTTTTTTTRSPSTTPTPVNLSYIKKI